MLDRSNGADDTSADPTDPRSDIPFGIPADVLAKASGATEEVDLQLAIYSVVAKAKGSSAAEARRMLEEEIERRQVIPPTESWMNAAVASAAVGKPYILSNEARWGAEEALREVSG
ncbi:hypothetical protein E8P82_01420 [Arthrobacter echini]|uniref:Uncharacterized protein n=1 Tax=Arthrobacter echini TaxID=1529066 RepID=A0A4S5EA24_9MICC|nr:hypothetical protein [Arthrobacter echini]THJ68597.1 hypothetical protein E8P82_01420 [Arthrobacter echini]